MAWRAILVISLIAFAEVGATQAQTADVATLTARTNAARLAGRLDEAVATATQLVEAVTRQSGADSLELATALDTLGQLLMQQGKWEPAAPHLRKALDIRTSRLPAKHRDLADSLLRLARVLEETSKFSDGRKLAERGLKMRQELLPPKDLEIAAAHDLMAELLRGESNPQRALEHARAAADIRAEVQGKEHLDYGRTLSTLGGIYTDAENFKDAQPVIAEAIRIREKAGDTDVLGISALWFNLARIHRDLGRTGEAEVAANRSLELRSKALGGDSIAVARTVMLLGDILKAAGKYQQADERMESAIAIFAKRAPSSRDVADALAKRGEIQAEQGHLAEAIKLHKQALAMREATTGKTSRAVLYSLNSLALTNRAAGDYPEAEKYAKQAIEIGRKNLEPHHKGLLATSLSILVGVYLDQQRLADGAAERLAQEALQIRRATLGQEHQEVATSLNTLAAISRAKGTPEGFAKAEEHYRQALAIRRAKLDPQHPSIASVHNGLAGLYRAWGSEKAEAAERAYAEAIDIYAKGGSGQARSLAVALTNRAAFFADYKRYDLAKADIERAQEIRRRLFGTVHTSLAGGLVQLARIDAEQGKVADAERQLKQALEMHTELAKRGDSRPLEKARIHETLARAYVAQDKHKPAYDELVLAYDLKKDRDPGVAATMLLLAESASRAGIKDGDRIAADFRQRASLIAEANLVRRAVLFGTVRRKADKATDCRGAFGRESVRDTAMGHVEITLGNDTAKVQVSTADDDRQQPPDAEVRATRDFLCTKLSSVVRDDLVALANKRIADARTYPLQAIVFVHGFNNTFADAVARTAQIAHDIGFDGAVFSFSWASRGGLSSYVFDRNNASAGAESLSRFLKDVVARTRARTVHLVAHSMGSRVLLEALERVRTEDRNLDKLRVGEVILVAPDIDKTNYFRLTQAVPDLHGRITVYASKLDRPLRFSGWLGGPTAGYVSPSEGALVAAGVETIDVSEAGRMFAFNHFFNENPKLFSDIRKTIQSSDHPPERRAPALFVKTKGSLGEYWEFKQAGVAIRP